MRQSLTSEMGMSDDADEEAFGTELQICCVIGKLVAISPSV